MRLCVNNRTADEAVYEQHDCLRSCVNSNAMHVKQMKVQRENGKV